MSTTRNDATALLRRHRQAGERTVQCIRDITAACKTAHEKRHVLECPECYGKVIDAVRSRYLEPGTDAPPEWFTGRAAFLADLDRMFASVKDYRARLEDIDRRIRREKVAWYLGRLKEHPYFRELATHLADESMPVEELERTVRAETQCFKGQPIDLEEFLKVRGEADSDKMSDEMIRRLCAIQDATYPTDWLTSKEAPLRKYDNPEAIISAIEAREGHPDSSADARAVRDWLQKQAHLREEIDRVRSRIDELHRAKAAHESQQAAKLEKKLKLTAKAFFEGACQTCGKEPDLKDRQRKVISCVVCHVLLAFGAIEKQTSYCSDECVRRGSEKHIREKHRCDAGSECTSLTQKEVSPAEPWACKECAGEGRLALFCSSFCASLNLSSHLKINHPELWERTGGPERKPGSAPIANSEGLLSDMEELYRTKVASMIEDKDLMIGDGDITIGWNND